VPYKADQLIRLKIEMRESEHRPRPRQPLGNSDPSALYGGEEAAMLGSNEGTVRFLFGPPGVDRSADPEVTHQHQAEQKHRRTHATEPTSPGTGSRIISESAREHDSSSTRRHRGHKGQSHHSGTAAFHESPPIPNKPLPRSGYSNAAASTSLWHSNAW